MNLKLSAILLALTVSNAFAQRWVDGSTNPEAVSDSTAYIFLFQSLTPGKNEATDRYAGRVKAYTSSLMGLLESSNGQAKSETELVMAAVHQFRGVSDWAIQERARIIPPGSAPGAHAKAQLTSLQREFEARVLGVAAELIRSLQPAGRKKLADHILYVKRHSRVLTN